MPRKISPLLIFCFLILIILALIYISPAERSLGVNVRLVYLHGAMVWTALLGLGTSALSGLIGLATRRPNFQRWSIALGQAGTFFWVTYLPLSLWTMQANWNGLYLAEPRWRIGLDFAIIGLLIQGAILLIQRPAWASCLNVAFFISLSWALSQAKQVMHPPSPILSSGSLVIRGFFAVLIAMCLFAAWQLSRWMHKNAAYH
jgi:hypothetical protein